MKRFGSWVAGMEAANGVAMMFGVHGAEKIGGRFVAGLLLSAAPFHKQAVADAPEQAHQAHGLGQAHPAQVLRCSTSERICAGLCVLRGRVLASTMASPGLSWSAARLRR